VYDTRSDELLGLPLLLIPDASGQASRLLSAFRFRGMRGAHPAKKNFEVWEKKKFEVGIVDKEGERSFWTVCAVGRGPKLKDQFHRLKAIVRQRKWAR